MLSDILATIANIIIAYSLIPQVFHGFKHKKQGIILQTSLLTTIALTMLAISFFSLKLLFAGSIATLNALMWLTILIQRLIYKN